MERLCPAERAALEQLVGWVRSRFGARVRELTLFGSRARAQGDEDSDVDVLVAIDDVTSEEAREIAYICGDLLTEHDVIVSPLVLATARLDELRRRERLIVREIARDGVRL
ncbi:MAG: nucleotidyltransferase domain-containing protein [Deltaproteobacteria bacterium]|nr:nucleotidyltransferase domain-containing protein [Nannocystaceae bacterium]